MNDLRKQGSRPAPRLVKAADVAARATRAEANRPAQEARKVPGIDGLLRAAAGRVRGARDARALFDSLFEKPAGA